jgi:ABC-type sugar transport system ATPase subunit
VADQATPEPDAPDAANAAPGIRLTRIVKRYGDLRVLDDITLDIKPGAVHALVGANGAGKSTLGKILAGVVRPDGGQILVDGRAARWRGPYDARREGIAMIAQELAVQPHLTVMQNIFFGIEPQRRGIVARRQMEQRYAELIARWPFRLARDAPVGRLRMADQQKVEILRAVAATAKVIVMDEPTSSLTHIETEILHEIIAELRAQGTTVVYVSHFLDDVLAVADTVSVLRNGLLVDSGPAARWTEASLVQAMFGDAPDVALAGRTQHRAAPVALEVRDLRRGRAIRGVSLSIHEGEIVGLAGLAGSGRSSLARALFGIDRAEGGTVSVAGAEKKIRSPADAIRAGLALVPESRKDDGLFMEMSAGENITFTVLRSLAARFGLLRPKAEAATARDMMSQLAIVAASPKAPVAALSGGNQQKVLFAKWLLRHPGVFILDEPTRGVDVSARATIHRLIGDLAAAGAGILLISSEFEEVIELSHRVLVIREGRIVAEHGADPPLATVMEAAFGMGPAADRANGAVA